MTVKWSDAGNPKAELTLDDVRRWAEEYGYVKTSVPKDRPAAQRVDLVAFFNVYDTNAFSIFKKKFRTRRLKPPNEPQDDYSDEEDEEEELAEEDIVQFLSDYEKHKDYESLKWRYVKRPGGQAVRPELWYRCYGITQFLNEGENKTPAPVWKEDGSIDYGGREKWDAWSACTGMTEQRAKIEFVLAVRKALQNPKENFY